MKFLGTIIQERFAPGSKSERPAIFLQTDAERILLRRKDGNSMLDPTLMTLIGVSVEVEGVVHQNVLIAEVIRRSN